MRESGPFDRDERNATGSGIPWWGTVLVRLLVGESLRDVVVGDLAEEYAADRVERGGWRASLRMAAELRSMMRPSVLRRLRQRTGERGKGGRQRMDALGRDIRYGVRSIRRSPGFAAIAVLTLALGIGANALVFAVVDGLVLNPFPFPEPNQLVGVGTQFPRLGGDLSFVEHMSPAEYQDIATGSRSLERVVAWDMGNRQVTFGDATENLFSGFWWGDAFPTLGVSPILGRGFTEAESMGGDRVAILSHRVWQDRFGADPELVGSAVLVNGDPYTVVGIMPPGTLVYGMDLWLPMGTTPTVFPRNRRQFQILARIVPGATLASVNSELETIARRIEGEYGPAFEEYEDWRLAARTWTDINVSALRPMALVLMSAVAFVLVLVCANVASLMLARASGRQREMAIRAALGAGRGRVIRQLMTESVVLAVLGGLAGGLLGWMGVEALSTTLATLSLFTTPGDLSINTRVLAFTVVAALASGFAFGIAPALQALRFEPQRTLQGESNSVAGSRARLRAQRVLVGVEVALAVLLVCGSALLVHSFVKLQRVDTGFDPKSVLTMRLTLPWEKYPPERIEPFFSELRSRVEAIPGAVSVATASQFPPRAFLRSAVTIEGEPPANTAALPVAFTTIASPGYFETMRIPLIRGRTFADADRESAPFVAVVNEAAARQFFPGGEALGRRVRPAEEEGPWFEIVGIVGSARNQGLEAPPEPEIFASSLQAGSWSNQQFLLVRSAVAPRTLLPAIREAVQSLDAQQPVYAVRTVEEVFAAAQAQRRVSATAITMFGLFALVLAAVGIYGVVSYAASQRTREIGVRMALGAERTQVRGMVVRQAILPVGIGAVVGLAAAIASGRLVAGLLFDLSATDPLTLTVAAGVILLVALVAAWVPAARASALSPVSALRPE